MNPSLFGQTFNKYPSFFQETFCFCARQRCNSSNSPPSPNPLLSLLAFLFLFYLCNSSLSSVFLSSTLASLLPSPSPMPLLASSWSLSMPPCFSSMTLEAVSETSNPPFSIFPPDAVLIFHRQAKISVVYQSYGAQSERLPLSHHPNHNELSRNIHRNIQMIKNNFSWVYLTIQSILVIFHELYHMQIVKNNLLHAKDLNIKLRTHINLILEVSTSKLLNSKLLISKTSH